MLIRLEKNDQARLLRTMSGIDGWVYGVDDQGLARSHPVRLSCLASCQN